VGLRDFHDWRLFAVFVGPRPSGNVPRRERRVHRRGRRAGRVPNENPVHGGAGIVQVGTKSWASSAVDDLEGEYTLGGKAATVSLDFLVRIDQISQQQNVEIAKLKADHFIAHVNLVHASDELVSVEVRAYGRDSMAEITSPLPLGVISDHSWHAIHLEVSTADSPVTVQNRFSTSCRPTWTSRSRPSMWGRSSVARTTYT
jgi:hypothetical protein